MDEPHFYEIRIQGSLAERWSDWFAGWRFAMAPVTKQL
jgi:hypothetical protein